MALNWSSWSEFAAMGGYGLYVWGSFGVVLLALVAELAQLAMRRNAVKRMAADPLQPDEETSGIRTDHGARPQHEIRIHES